MKRSQISQRNRWATAPAAAGSALFAALLAVSSIALAQGEGAKPDPAQYWIGLVTPYVLKAVGAIVFFVVARIVAAWVARSIVRVLSRRKFDETLTRFFSAAAKSLIMLAAVLGILGMFGVQTTSFAAVIGAAGLAIGLAFQGTLGNFASGILLLTFRPFNVGDVVTTGGETGTIEEIGLFTTTMIDPDNRKITIPNSSVTGANIANLTVLGTRRVSIDVGTDYGADLKEVRKVLEMVAPRIDKGLKTPEPQVFLAGLGASSIDWKVRVWAKSEDYWEVREQVVAEIKFALDAAKIGIPFPQMDVHLDKAT